MRALAAARRGGARAEARRRGLFEFGLSGTIPASIGALTGLTGLCVLPSSHRHPLRSRPPRGLGGNRLRGSIPDALCLLTRLTVLDLTDNALTGPIPPDIGNLVLLTSLGARGGARPAALHKNLVCVWLTPALLHPRPVPAPAAAAASTVLYNNLLQGSVPDSIGSLTALTSLGLSQNQLSGGRPLAARRRPRSLTRAAPPCGRRAAAILLQLAVRLLAGRQRLVRGPPHGAADAGHGDRGVRGG